MKTARCGHGSQVSGGWQREVTICAMSSKARALNERGNTVENPTSDDLHALLAGLTLSTASSWLSAWTSRVAHRPPYDRAMNGTLSGDAGG